MRFRIHADGTNYTVLHSFTGGTSDGESPYAGLSADPSGNLCGTTDLGGVNGASTVFSSRRMEAIMPCSTWLLARTGLFLLTA